MTSHLHIANEYAPSVSAFRDARRFKQRYSKPDALRPGYRLSADAGAYAVGKSSGFAFGGPFGFLKNTLQGAAAGLLGLLGSIHLTGALPEDQRSIEDFSNLDAASVEGVAQALFASGAPGVLEIMGAVALFLNAGRGAGRMIGLVAFVAVAVFYANGMDAADFLERITELADYAQSFAQRAQAAQTAQGL